MPEGTNKLLATQLLCSHSINARTALRAGHSDLRFATETVDTTLADRTLLVKPGYAGLL